MAKPARAARPETVEMAHRLSLCRALLESLLESVMALAATVALVALAE